MPLWSASFHGMFTVVKNIGLKLFKLEVTIGVLYFPKPAFNAVLWLPNKSSTMPSRGDQFLKHPNPGTVLQSTLAKLRAGTKRPAGELSGSISFDRYSQRRPTVIDSCLTCQVS